MSSPREAQLPLLLSISEGLSRGTDEMLRVSPQGDAMHPPSCSLAIRESVEEIKWLRAEVERLRAELDRTREQLDAAVALIAEWCRAVDGGASWDYWDDHYKQARWGKGVLRSLIDAEIAKLEPLEGEP